MSVGLLILGLVLFVGLVVVHEFGHFLAARSSGVKVEEFGIGFPPTIWAKRMRSGFLFTINLLPLGGFVRLKGEHDADKGQGSFGAAPLKVKIKIMLAGVVMNLTTALALLTLLALIGLPKLFDNQFTIASDTKVVNQVQDQGAVFVAEVLPGSPAASVGLKEKDQIISLNQIPIASSQKLSDLTKQHAGQEVTIIIKRDNATQTLKVNLQPSTAAEQGYLGVVSGEAGLELRRSTWSAPLVAVGLSAQFSKLTYQGLGAALGGLLSGDAQRASQQVSGPVGIFVILRDGSSLGFNFILMVIAVLSLTLALINILPIPALDGGRLFITLLFRALKKPLTRQTEEWIHGAGFALLMLLFVLITIVDINRIG